MQEPMDVEEQDELPEDDTDMANSDSNELGDDEVHVEWAGFI